MDTLAQDVLARLPLAEAVLTAWRWLADEAFLEELFDQHRGHCYTKELSFTTLVHLLHDVLIGAAASAHERFTQARIQDELPVHLPAAYQKLGRLPLPLSMAFVSAGTARLREVVPDPHSVTLPTCLEAYAVVTLDGKAVKQVAKRLKPLRGWRGGVLGGRALVAQDMRSGLILAMHADPDGEANDIRFVPDLVPALRTPMGRPIMWVADRQFGFPEVLASLSTPGDRFLVRYHGNVTFTPDPERPVQTGTDAHGRAYRQEWGWLGGLQNRHRRYVRRITLALGPKQSLVLVTDLLDAAQYPAADLLVVYRQRWGIENVFQQITEIFGLARLIGGTPEATVFQLSFCLVLYNLIQSIRGLIATAAQRPLSQVSGEKVLRDVTKELISWRTILQPGETVAYFPRTPTAAAVQARLQALLAGLWRPQWLKAKPKKKVVPHPSRPYHRGAHKSVHQVLLQNKQDAAREAHGK